MASSSPFTAKFPGECAACPEPVRPGDVVRFENDELVHANCAEAEAEGRTRPVEVCTTCWLTKPCGCDD